MQPLACYVRTWVGYRISNPFVRGNTTAPYQEINSLARFVRKLNLLPPHSYCFTFQFRIFDSMGNVIDQVSWRIACHENELSTAASLVITLLKKWQNDGSFRVVSEIVLFKPKGSTPSNSPK